MLESDDIHLCRCNANSDNRKVSIIYCVSRNIIPNIGRDKSLADDLNMLRGIVSRGVVFALRPAEIRPLSQRFVRMDISPPTTTRTTHYNATSTTTRATHTHPRPISTAPPQHPARAYDEKNRDQAHPRGESPTTNHGASQRLPPRIPPATITHTCMLMPPTARSAVLLSARPARL